MVLALLTKLPLKIILSVQRRIICPCKMSPPWLLPLLHSYSLTEEWSIKQITSFVSVVHLQNSIGSRGSTSCIWNNSKLALLLPNLPVEMRIIVVTYHTRGCTSNNEPSSTKSYQFLHCKIERDLYLMDQTKLPKWQGKVCPERLSSRPEEGNPLNLPGLEHMEDELDPYAQCEEQATNPEGLNTYDADHVPTPMQSGEHPDETFEGTFGGCTESTTCPVSNSGRRSAPSR
jgi:hypothetical protein